MTPLVSTLVTALVLTLGAGAIVYALRFFPIVKDEGDQLELDLDVAPEYLRKARVAAHDAHRAADVIREETARLKAKPRIKR